MALWDNKKSTNVNFEAKNTSKDTISKHKKAYSETILFSFYDILILYPKLFTINNNCYAKLFINLKELLMLHFL